MTIDDIELCEMDEQLAYVLGLCYPLYKEIEYDSKKYILGSCNHNKISGEELVAHIKAVQSFLKKSHLTENVLMLDNSIIKVPKKGFSIMIEKNKPYSNIFKKTVQQILEANTDIKKMFIRGCFDGRGSWDTSAHYISLDVDRDTHKQTIIAQISSSLGIELNINNRGKDAEKNDQIRVIKKCVNKFLVEIGLFSECRKNIIKNNIKLKDS